MEHLYKATDKANGIEYTSGKLSDVTREVRKFLPLKHGQLIRTDLIEQGRYEVAGPGRNINIRHIHFHFVITVERFPYSDGRSE